MLDGSDIAPDFIHVPADVFEVGFQLGDARFHVRFSSGFGAAVEVSGVAGATLREWSNRAHWQSGFLTMH
jgi:hypothetical protein